MGTAVAATGAMTSAMTGAMTSATRTTATQPIRPRRRAAQRVVTGAGSMATVQGRRRGSPSPSAPVWSGLRLRPREVRENPTKAESLGVSPLTRDPFDV